ncbi:TonB-dependent receptor [Shewanella sp. NR704-98]|uniref:TonB-dependent receptor n=2 Tax=Shewanella nanhaiensis TaxID=2864872 RepID=A0ABS7E2Z0_9GAMM|nr:TonB-dependent receptor [Shewanella nanhaiensis]
MSNITIRNYIKGLEMRRTNFKKSVLATSIAVVLTSSSPSLAIAAEETNADDNIEIIEVTGIRASSKASINQKRFATSQVDGITAEDIGKLPDVTIADSLQRITGVQITRSAGEGGTIAIRGLPQVGTTMNGEVFLSATTIDTSGANFGDLPAQLFSGLEVFKSAEASRSAKGISGSVDLKTRRPFDMDTGWTFNAAAEASQGSISEETDPNFNGLVSFNNDKFGVLFSAAKQQATLATDYNGYFDTSEDGGIGAANNSHTWGAGPNSGDIRHVVPQGFAAFNKQEERDRDAFQLSVQADLGEGFTLTADAFYSKQERFNNRSGFSQNNRWQSFNDYAFPSDGFTDDTPFTDDDGNEWRGVNAFDMKSYRMQSFTQVNINEEESQNYNLQLDYDNGGALTGGVRMTRAKAEASMRHAYGEGDILSIDQGTLVTGPGGLAPASYCNNGEEIVGDQGGCFAQYSQGIQDQFMLNYDARGEHPHFSGFNQMVNGGKGMRSVGDYMSDLDSYHVGAFSSEGNTDDVGEINTFSTAWNYAFDDMSFITSVDFGVRYEERKVDHDQFTYTSEFGGGCDIAQWKAVDQFYGDECVGVDGAGEMVDGEWTPYTLLAPTRLDEHTSVSYQTDFGNVTGIPGVWVIDPENFRDPRQFQKDVFGNVQRVENAGRTYDVNLNEFSYFLQANFEEGIFSGNFGVKVVETEQYVKQNLVGPSLPHSGLNPDIGDVVTERDYTDVLPSINVAAAVTDDVILRAAYAKNMMPLNLGALGGGKSVGKVFNEECGCLRVVEGSLAGSPDLDPWRSTNYSVSAEWYNGDASMMFISAFNIDIESFVGSGTVMIDEPDDDGVKRGPWPFSTPVQAEGGSIKGLELGARVAFDDFIDVPVLSNFGLDANYTYSDSTQDSDLAKDVYGSDLPFPGMSEDTYNFVLWYEQEDFSTRLAWNSVSPRLITTGGAGVGGQTLYQDTYSQLDFSATYNLNEMFSFYVYGSNILEEYQQTYLENSSQKAFQNVYEARWTLGARMTF